MEPTDNVRLANLCGQFDEHLRLMERRLGVEINNWGGRFQVQGDRSSTELACVVLQKLYRATALEALSSREVHLCLQESGAAETDSRDGGGRTTSGAVAGAVAGLEKEAVVLKTRKVGIKARGHNQRSYLDKILSHDINFGIGPAGTGKTYLAVACAVDALEREQVRRLVLTRPAVEAGERLGFLPGDLAQKVDPYLRPLYDALYEMLGAERVAKLIERHVIEIAPLAYMRGRTLNESFIILDEAQNTTAEQMKMFLTRIGFGSTVVVTGDLTQIDLPGKCVSGLRQVKEVLKDIDGISFTFFNSHDVVRHPLIRKIVEAYDQFEPPH